MKKYLILALTIILAVCALTACRPRLRLTDDDGNTIEYSMQGDTVTVSGENGDVTIATGGSATWPTGKVGDLPEFQGNVESLWESDDSIMITMENVKLSDTEGYIKLLESKGWVKTSEFIMDEEDFVGMWSFRKGDKSVDLMYTSANGFFLITYGDYKDPEAWREDYDWDDDYGEEN